MKTLRRLASAEIRALGDNEVEVILSTSNKARDGHVLLARGADLESFRQNPVVLFSHDPTEPVGRCSDVSIQGDKIVAKVRFASPGVSPTADRVRGLVKDGVITAMSIGFDPDYRTAKPVDPAEPRSGKVFSRWTLLEASFVAVPSDTGAIVTQRSHSSTKSIRSVEAQLRAGGMSAAEAKRLAATWQDFSESKGSEMNTSALTRAVSKFAPGYRAILFVDPSERRGPVSINELTRARAAIMDGPDGDDVDSFEADLQLARDAVVEIDRMIAEAKVAQSESARTALPVEGQERRLGASASGSRAAPLLRNVQTGEAIRAYRHNEQLAPFGAPTDYGLGDLVRASCTGDWNRLPGNVRTTSGGVGAGGGFLVPSEMAGWAVDLARAKARVMQAGALSVPMQHGNLTVAVVTGDPQAAWKAEGAPFKTSQGTYGQIILRSKTLGVTVPISLELVMSAQNLNEIVTTQLTQALGLQLDMAAIAGDGTVNTPRGIVPVVPSGQIFPVGGELVSATPSTPSTAYGYWSKAIGAVLAENAELSELSILHNSQVDSSLDALQDSLSQPLRPTPNFAAIKDAGRVYVANGIPTLGDTPATYSLVGDFHQVLFGMQQSLSLEVDRSGGYVNDDGTMGNAFAQGLVMIRAMIMCDVAILRPNLFAQVDDIRFA
jgi:HK97 family phage major capsid protein/HK97 family phage prohead protease